MTGKLTDFGRSAQRIWEGPIQTWGNCTSLMINIVVN